MAPLPLGGTCEKNHGCNNGSYPVGTSDVHELPKVSIIVLCRSWIELRGGNKDSRVQELAGWDGGCSARLPLFVELVMVLVRRGGVLLRRSLSSIKAEVKTLYNAERKYVSQERYDQFPTPFHLISCHFFFTHYDRQTKLLQLSDDPYAYTRYLPA